ncbi:MAG: site-specific DNA-methyltransferase [Sphaerochaetaceae bacterium]
MEKMGLKSMDIVEENFKRIEELFPEAIVETEDDNGNEIRKIDIHRLSQEMSNLIVDSTAERYQFTWPNKKNSILLSNLPIDRTLRPEREKSVDFDNTENLYIEGDNLDVLKLLQKSYQGKIKCIYIDPPYNTGHDFVYEDDFASSASEFAKMEKNIDAEGNKLRTNSDAEGKYHTNWLNMMYPRLRLAKRLLTEDGVIFISIDDNEQANLKKMCDEVFGLQNFVAQLVWERAYSPKNDARFISNSHDYVLMYSKDINKFKIGRLPRTEEANARYTNPDNDPRGIWKPSDMSVKTYNSVCDYPITTPSGRIIEPPAGRCWSLSKKAFSERLSDNRIYFGADGNSVPCIKRFLNELKFEGMAPASILFYKEVGHSQEGAQEVSKLLEGGFFDGPKPVRLLLRLLTLANLDSDSIVLDFFSGSATTAQAVMQMNSTDSGKRKFIMVQVAEKCQEGDKAFQAGYKNICEIGEERIRRAGKKILSDLQEKGGDLFSEEKKLDTGFRVLKLDSSNMNDVDQIPEKFIQKDLDNFIGNFKPDRSSEDLLFQSLLSYGLDLSSKINVKIISGVKVYSVNEGYLIACLDNGVNDEVVTEIAKAKPRYALFRDSAITEDSTLTNFDQIFQQFSPETERSVL